MILADSEILKAIKDEEIIISPFNMDNLGPNSYDVTLAPEIKVYQKTEYLDMAVDNPTDTFYLPDNGFVLQPGELYLGRTNECVGAPTRFLPDLEGRSSIGRLGIAIHVTAGFFDIGFNGTVTLEIKVVRPVKVYPNIRIGQLSFEEVKGKILRPYQGKYQGQVYPESSRLYKDF